MQTYAEELDVVQDMVVEREVIASDDTSAGILLNFPVCGAESLSGFHEVFDLELTAPVSLGGLLELTVA